MKSPWKFLTRLGIRRRQQTQDPMTIEHRPRPEVEIEETQVLSQAIGTLEASETTDTVEQGTLYQAAAPENETADDRDWATLPSIDIPEVHEAARIEIEDREGRKKHSTPESDTSSQAKTLRRNTPRARVKRSLAETIQIVPAANSNKGEEFSAPEKPFYEEVAELDEEIRQLRVQLAHKLRLQNVQLKKMLERFDVS